MCGEALGSCWAVNRLSGHSAQVLAVVSPFGIVQDDNFCFLISSHYFFPFDGVGAGGSRSLRVVASGHFQRFFSFDFSHSELIICLPPEWAAPSVFFGRCSSPK